MIHLRHLILILLGVLLSATSLLIFLVGVPLLVNRSLSQTERICGTLLYTLIAFCVAYIAWRAFAAARKIKAANAARK
jgi:hypothetical protein